MTNCQYQSLWHLSRDTIINLIISSVVSPTEEVSNLNPAVTGTFPFESSGSLPIISDECVVQKKIPIMFGLRGFKFKFVQVHVTIHLKFEARAQMNSASLQPGLRVLSEVILPSWSIKVSATLPVSAKDYQLYQTPTAYIVTPMKYWGL